MKQGRVSLGELGGPYAWCLERLITSKNSSDFKVPKNAYDEAAFDDPEYKTLCQAELISNDDIFLQKKVSGSKEKKSG